MIYKPEYFMGIVIWLNFNIIKIYLDNCLNYSALTS